ncbi:MAG: BamA/TamA family outer membrane protein [Bradymonadia bacterium]
MRIRIRSLLVVLLVLWAGLAWGQSGPEQSAKAETSKALNAEDGSCVSALNVGGETYQGQRLARALKAEGLAFEANPLGKRVAFVRIARRDVFAEDELWPTFPNALHWLTKPRIIEQELLVSQGQPFKCVRVYESIRNLRSLGIFSLVAIAPVKADSEDEVGILVLTRDLWSLRLEQSYSYTAGQFDQLLLQITERNLFGLNQQGTLRYQMFPDRYSVGEVFVDRRLGGAPLRLAQSADVIFNRDSDEAEGFSTSWLFGHPLYNLQQPWGLVLEVQTDVRVQRQLTGGEVRTYTFQADENSDPVSIPRVWDQRFYIAELTSTHQMGVGTGFRHRVGYGVAAVHIDAEANDETGALTDEEQSAFETDVLPQRLTRVAPFVEWSFFQPRFKALANLATFGQSEDIRVGPSIGARLSSPLTALGSDKGSLRGALSAGWVHIAGGGLIEGAVGVEGRYEDEELINRELTVTARGATPQLGVGRLIARGVWVQRIKDRNNSLVTLGGDNGLRGYPSQAFFGFGENFLRTNVELRTRPWVLASVHLGGVLFWDAGDVYAGGEDFTLRQTVGAGVRVLMPQFNQDPFRLDFGVPVDGSGFMVLLSSGSSQAVPLTRREDLQ